MKEIDEEYNIFNSIIWKTKLIYDQKHKFIEFIEKEYESIPNKVPKNWKCSIHSSFGDWEQNKSIIPNILFELINDRVNQFLNLYQEKINLPGNYYLEEMWYNVCKIHQFQEIHDHGNCIFSGCYYMQFDPNYHHQTRFLNPNFAPSISKQSNNPFYSFTPFCQEDDLIIFPSFLKHGTAGVKLKNNIKIKPRITVSFNIKNTCINYHHKKIIKYF